MKLAFSSTVRSQITVPTYDFELTVDGEEVQIIRVERRTLEEARRAAEETAEEFRNSLAGQRAYRLDFLREVRIADP